MVAKELTILASTCAYLKKFIDNKVAFAANFKRFPLLVRHCHKFVPKAH